MMRWMRFLQRVHERVTGFPPGLLVLSGWIVFSTACLMKYWYGGVAFSWDDSLHGLNVYKHTHFLKAFLANGHWDWIHFYRLSTYYPPFLYILTGLLSIIMGFSVGTLGSVTVFFYAGSVIVLYFLLKELKLKSLTALCLTLLFSWLVPTQVYSRSFLLEVPLTFFLLCFYYQIIHWTRISSSKSNNWVFIFASMALWVKWTALPYLLVPLGWYVYGEVRRKGFLLFLRYHFKGMIIFGLTVLPWYFINMQTLVEFSPFFAKAEVTDPLRENFMSSLLYYPNVWRNWLGLTGVGLAFVGVLSFFKTRDVLRERLLLGSLVFVYLIFTFGIENKDSRYLFPLAFMLLAFVGLAIERILSYVPRRRDKWVVVGLVTMLFIEVRVGRELPSQIGNMSVRDVLKGLFTTKENGNEEAILYKTIVDDFEHQTEWETMLVATDFAYVNPFSISFYASINNDSPERYHGFEEFYGRNTIEETRELLGRYDTVLVSGGVVAEFGSRHASLLENIQFAVLSRPDLFLPIKEYRMGNGQVAWLYSQVRK